MLIYLYRWLFVPRGCAVFYVPIRNQSLIRTTFPTSHGFEPHDPALMATRVNPHAPSQEPQTDVKALPPIISPFVNLFRFIATTDNSPYYCIPSALDFRATVCGGEANLMAYIRSNARLAGDLVAQILDTEVMQSLSSSNHIPSTTTTTTITTTDTNDNPNPSHDVETTDTDATIRACAFANVRLPLPTNASSAATLAATVQATLRDEFATFLPVYEYAGALWVRLSGQVYLDAGDWEWCANVLAEVCARGREGNLV
jgi:hypothetical protein